jgi:hypothetical protein
LAGKLNDVGSQSRLVIGCALQDISTGSPVKRQLE